MSNSTPLLYVTFKQYPELGRLKAVSDRELMARDDVDNICAHCALMHYPCNQAKCMISFCYYEPAPMAKRNNY